MMFAGSDPSWLTAAVSWAALASSMLAVAGVAVLRRQFKQAERSLLGSTSQFCYESMSTLLQQLVAYPHLRPYLYGNAPLPSETTDPILHHQVVTLSAQYADFFDALVLQQELGNISDYEYRTVWRRFIRHMLVSSSAIREYCLEHSNWYSPTLVALARDSMSAPAPGPGPD
jgi:hypothetical protein